jgi:flavin reductase (DIM6/NTAB) family NADH-FMN oxidoreductase RutF
MKINIDTSKVNFPMPSVLISCQFETKLDIITISWISMISLNPPTIMISFLKTRFSLSLIQKSGKFGVNVPSKNDIDSLNHCGIISGKDHDKFLEESYTPYYHDSDLLTPLIQECPINILCKMIQTIDYKDRIVLFGLVEKVLVEEGMIKENKQIDLEKIKPFVYWMSGGEYWDIGSLIGTVKEGKK